MQIFLKNQTDIFEDVVKQDALGNRQLRKRWQIKGGLTFKACSHDPFLRIRFLLVPKSDRVNTLQMTFRHPHHKNGTLKSDHLNTCFQFLKPNIESLKTDCVNGPLCSFYKILRSPNFCVC